MLHKGQHKYRTVIDVRGINTSNKRTHPLASFTPQLHYPEHSHSSSTYISTDPSPLRQRGHQTSGGMLILLYGKMDPCNHPLGHRSSGEPISQCSV